MENVTGLYMREKVQRWSETRLDAGVGLTGWDLLPENREKRFWRSLVRDFMLRIQGWTPGKRRGKRHLGNEERKSESVEISLVLVPEDSACSFVESGTRW